MGNAAGTDIQLARSSRSTVAHARTKRSAGSAALILRPRARGRSRAAGCAGADAAGGGGHHDRARHAARRPVQGPERAGQRRPRRTTSRSSARSPSRARGLSIVRSPVALHVESRRAAAATAIPVSLLGAIAFVRQSFLDAQYQQTLDQRYQKIAGGSPRPAVRPALDALQPALARPPAGRVRGQPAARDHARARHGEGVQPVADHHRRRRSGPGGGRSEGGRTRRSSSA